MAHRNKKLKRKRRRMRNIKTDAGVSGLYFSEPFKWHFWSEQDQRPTLSCSHINRWNEVKISNTKFREILKNASDGQYKIKYVDEDLEFDDLDELRRYKLIVELSGID